MQLQDMYEEVKDRVVDRLLDIDIDSNIKSINAVIFAMNVRNFIVRELIKKNAESMEYIVDTIKVSSDTVEELEETLQRARLLGCDFIELRKYKGVRYIQNDIDDMKAKVSCLDYACKFFIQRIRDCITDPRVLKYINSTWNTIYNSTNDESKSVVEQLELMQTDFESVKQLYDEKELNLSNVDSELVGVIMLLGDSVVDIRINEDIVNKDYIGPIDACWLIPEEHVNSGKFYKVREFDLSDCSSKLLQASDWMEIGEIGIDLTINKYCSQDILSVSNYSLLIVIDSLLLPSDASENNSIRLAELGLNFIVEDTVNHCTLNEVIKRNSTNMDRMFYGTQIPELKLNKDATQHIESAVGAFANVRVTDNNIRLAGFDNLKNADHMFDRTNCYMDKDLKLSTHDFKVSNIETAECMFDSFRGRVFLPLSFSKLKDASGMFQSVYSVDTLGMELPVVEDTSYMFYQGASNKLNLAGFNMKNVKNAESMFDEFFADGIRYCEFDMSSCENMESLFSYSKIEKGKIHLYGEIEHKCNFENAFSNCELDEVKIDLAVKYHSSLNNIFRSSKIKTLDISDFIVKSSGEQDKIQIFDDIAYIEKLILGNQSVELIGIGLLYNYMKDGIIKEIDSSRVTSEEVLQQLNSHLSMVGYKRDKR